MSWNIYLLAKRAKNKKNSSTPHTLLGSPQREIRLKIYTRFYIRRKQPWDQDWWAFGDMRDPKTTKTTTWSSENMGMTRNERLGGSTSDTWEWVVADNKTTILISTNDPEIWRIRSQHDSQRKSLPDPDKKRGHHTRSTRMSRQKVTKIWEVS
jgi:hypothetical protein